MTIVYGGVSLVPPLPPGGTTGQSLVKTSNTDFDVQWTTVSGGGGTPGGISGQVQYNLSGAFAGDAGFTYNPATHALALTGQITGSNLPAPSGISTQFLNGTGAWSTPAGGGGGVSWALATTNITAATGNYIFCDTTSAAFTVTLPITPASANNVTVKSGPSASTNNLTIARNGQTIMGLVEDMTISSNNIEVTLVFDGTTWRI